VAAALEMRVLRQLLARGWFNGTTESSQRVLSLLGGEISLLDIVRSKGIELWELSFRYIISILWLLSFAGLLALVSWWFITTPPPTYCK
jgi:hypothetical protein